MVHYTLTLGAAAQRLSDALPVGQQAPGSLGDVAYARLDLQPDGAAANPIYLGASNLVTATDYGVRLPASAAGVPCPPYTFEGPATVKLSHIWVKGTAGDKLHVLGIPF